REVTLLCGASGSGKSMLVKAISALFANRSPSTSLAVEATDQCVVEVRGAVGQVARVVALEELPRAAIPLELKGRASLEDFLQVAARCGLAEPQLFVRPIGSLSSGQRYRLKVALGFLKDPEILMIDNFCENLDIYTTVAVVKGITQLANELNV